MRTFRSTLIAAAVAAAAVGAVSTAKAAPILYGLSSSTPGTLYTINSGTGAATVVAPLSGSGETNTLFVGLGAINSTLYASDVYTAGGASFGTINATTGAFTAISNQSGFSFITGLAYNGLGGSSAGFYTVDDLGNLAVINATTGAVSQVDTAGTLDPFADVAYNGTTLFGIDAVTNTLDTINTTTGAATVIGTLHTSGGALDAGFDYGMSFNGSTLYVNTGAAGPSDSNDLFTVNTSNGLATLVGSNGAIAAADGLGIDGIAFVPNSVSVPEPTTIALAGLGVPALAVWAMKRRKKVEVKA